MKTTHSERKDRVDAEERAQLRRFAKLSFAEKVRWLEQAHRLTIQLGARKPRRQTST